MAPSSSFANYDCLLITVSCYLISFQNDHQTYKNQLVSRISCKTDYCEWAHVMYIQLVMLLYKCNEKHWNSLNLNNVLATEIYVHPLAVVARQNDAK